MSARFVLAEDACGEPTLWTTQGQDDPLPIPILSETSLPHHSRHLWPVIVQRIIDGGPA